MSKKQAVQQKLRTAVFSVIIKLPKMINTENYYKPIQLKLPVDYAKIRDLDDAVYTFVEVMNHITKFTLCRTDMASRQIILQILPNPRSVQSNYHFDYIR